MKHILGIATVLLLMLTVACSPSQQTPPGEWESTQVYFKLYGGFINPEYGVREYTINKDKIVLEVKSTTGVLKEHTEMNISKEEFTAITATLAANGYFQFESNYTVPENVRIADIGNAQLRVTTSLRDKTVDFIPYYQEGLPTKVKRVLESIDALIGKTIEAPMPNPKRPENQTSEDLSRVFISIEPKQCQGLAWKSWYAEGNIKFIKEPTETELVTTYYAQVYNITLSNVKKEITSEVVCEACGVCSAGYRLSAEGSEKDVATLQKDGWEVAMV